MDIVNPLNPPLPHQKKLTFGNLHGASLSLTLSHLSLKSKNPIVIITPDTLTAMRLEYELQFFAPTLTVINFPDWETLPYDQFSPHQDIISARLTALYHLPLMTTGIVLVPISTLMHRLVPPEFIQGKIFLLKVGDKFNLEKIRQQLEKSGYRTVDQVREHGEFAVRGAILDLFPTGSHAPYRIDLFDDEIDSIRTFSSDTQRSLDKVTEIALLPAKEFPLDDDAIELFRQRWRSEFSGNPLNCTIYQDVSEGIYTPGIEYYLTLFFKQSATLFDYLPEKSVMVMLENIHPKSVEFWQEIKTRYEQRSSDISHPILKPEHVFIPTETLFQKIQQHDVIKIQTAAASTHIHTFNFATAVPDNLNVNHKATQPLATLEHFIKHFKGRILFCAETTGRREVLLQLFQNIHLHPKIYASWDAFLQDTEHFGMAIASLEEGLLLENPSVALIAETQLFGQRIMQRRRRKETAQNLDAIVKDLTELQIGSPIVHLDHGVGRYLGLKTLNIGDQIAEYLHLEYAEGDKLYVPVSALHLISRYTGQDTDHAPLHKLGTSHWQRAKKKAAEQVRDIAAELLDLYAKREAQQGFAFQPLNGDYDAFAAAFPFEETPDQQLAIDAVIKDMTNTKPMDRLVCGDVGFGKTEVAMRAAFVAVQNGKQVVVLVPTTLLAQQHWQNFQDRFADWPIRIEMISRFKTGKEQQKVIEQLSEGKIDIVIGTHKLLQQNIQFKSLGLLIIDEEHRFGVQQKERLKALRYNVDILTLTATPIPRTLNMAFAGIRDLSIIATPPLKRLSIKTFVHEFQNPIIQEAVLREILRGGQVYFLHNEVRTIERMARDLEKLIPEARICVAHGQMHERELEKIMADFYHRRFNVLVSTTIIESGIDIPSANTIVINRADKLGLAQLHQLRGRVGRSHHQAYAYLLVPTFKNLTADAKKRLDAISTYEDLGIGFTLATHDLEIRGAGELLGQNQSGNMHEVGFTLYMDLLTRAVQALKQGQAVPDIQHLEPNKGPEIELHIPALIPDNYLGDVQLRLQFYKRIASAETTSALDDIQVEMIDRFGLLPEPIKNLFALAILKQRAQQLGITKIEASSKGGKIEFNEKPNINPYQIIKLIQNQSKTFKLEGASSLRFILAPHDMKERIHAIENIINLLIT